jgi:hypothetical protein
LLFVKNLARLRFLSLDHARSSHAREAIASGLAADALTTALRAAGASVWTSQVRERGKMMV